MIRPYVDSDLPLLAELYEQTVRRWAPSLYSPAQVEAWATMPRNAERFFDMVAVPRTFVAVDESDLPLGFGGIEPAGRIASLYVAADHVRQGVGSLLLKYLIRDASMHRMDEIWSEASQFSRPLFERHGFCTTKTEVVNYNGATFERWIVRRQLQPDQS
jgi:putative acetyltransferase